MLRPCLLIAGGLCAAALCAADPDPDVPDAAAKAAEQYAAAVQAHKGRYAAAVAALTGEYTRKLDGLIAKAQAAGDLDTALVLKGEVTRVEQTPGVKPGKLPADAQRALQDREAAAVKAKADTNARLKELHAGFVRELADVEQSATKGGQLATAVAVRTYRQRVEKEGAPILAGGNLAVLKAQSAYARAVKEAGGKLLQQFDRAGGRVAPLKLPPAKRDALLDVVKAEKKRFEADGSVPWSEPMRPATGAYIQAVQAARAQFRKTVEAELEKATKAADEATARELAAELRDTSEVRVVAVWGHQAGDGPRGRVTLYANGAVGNPAGRSTWHLDRAGKLVLRWPNAQAPGGFWVDTVQVSRSGKAYAGQNQRGTRINGVLVE